MALYHFDIDNRLYWMRQIWRSCDKKNKTIFWISGFENYDVLLLVLWSVSTLMLVVIYMVEDTQSFFVKLVIS